MRKDECRMMGSYALWCSHAADGLVCTQLFVLRVHVLRIVPLQVPFLPRKHESKHAIRTQLVVVNMLHLNTD
jgi:hypothetical protein